MAFWTFATSLLGPCHDAHHVQLWHHRALCLLAALLLPGLGFVLLRLDAAAVDPLWMRWALGGLFLAAFLASHASAWIEQRFTAVIHTLAYVLTLWLVALAAWNAFASEYTLQLLFGVSMLAVVLGIGPRRLKPLAWYLGFALALTVLALLTAPTAAVDKPFFIGLMASAALIVLIAAHWNVQAQQELAGTNAFYRQILDNMPMQAALFDLEGRYTFVSASAVRDPEMRRFLLGRTDVDYCRHRGKALQFGRERTAIIQSVARTGEEVRFEEPISTPEGAQKHYVRVISPVFSPDGQEVTHVLGYGIDLTERVQAEKALRASELRYRTLMDAANEAIFVANADTGMLTDANQAAQHLVGQPIEELRQMHQSELHPPEKRAAYKEIFRQHVLNGTTNHEAIYVVDRDGNWTPVEVNARVVTIEDERVVVAVFHDVTHRQRYERQLIAAKERAEELLKLKTSLLTNVSHEFRTPLSGIIGFADILVEENTGPQKEFAEMMGVSARRLHTTLDAVLDLAQLDSGDVPLHPSRIDLRAEVREAARSFRGRAEEKGLFLRVEPGDGPATAWADRTSLHRALSNLIGNAVKFTEAGGVTIRVHAAGADGAPPAVCIADTGVGIGPAFRPHLFEEFRQESEGNARRFEGSGLGLAVTQRLVRLMGGAITVESDKGVGSTFTVRLPAAAPAEAPVENGAPAGQMAAS